MKYSFERIATSTGIFPDELSVEEGEFNHVINPKLNLSQDALEYLMEDVTYCRPETALDVMFHDAVGEPIIPAHPFRVNEWFKRQIDRMVKNVMVVPQGRKNSSAVELAKLSELEAALAFIKESGDMPLRDCLSKEELATLPQELVAEDQVYDEILALSDRVVGLVLSREFDEALDRPRLTPKGRAVEWRIVDSERKDHVEKQLDRCVTDHYGLPSNDTYEFLTWKYLTEIRGFLFPPGPFWSDNERILADLGLCPMNAHSQYGGCDWTKYLQLRHALVEQGVDSTGFRQIEETFISYMGKDFLSKNEAVMQWPAFVLGRIFKADNVLLYDHLEREARRLLRRITDGLSPSGSSADRLPLFQATRQLKHTLESDLLMFMAFYSFVFLPASLPEIRGGMSEEPIRPSGSAEAKRGRVRNPGKAAILPIRQSVVDLLQRHAITHAYDEAAKILNALALRQVYSIASTGETRISAGQTLLDKKAPSKTGFLTKGGRVLGNELRRESQ